MMNNTNVDERIQFLDSELKSLKESISASDKASALSAALRRLNRFISRYQPLLTVVMAVATLSFLQMNFGVNYFAVSASKEANKRVSDFYRQLGDRLVYDAEYDEAATAYKSALALQPNDAQAIYGLAKAQMFKLPEGLKYSDTQLLRIKLDYLASFKDDADIEFLKCQTFLDLDDSKAELSCKKAIELNPRLYVAHINLGYICMKNKDPGCAKENFQKAVEINDKSGLANANLGVCELLELNVEDAKTRLEEAVKLRPNIGTMLDLGDAYRYVKQFDKAIDIHKRGTQAIEEKDIEKESIAGGAWLINAMPFTADDTETKKSYGIATEIQVKRAVLQYALTIDYALQSDFAAAQREFEKARENDRGNSFGDYFVNRGCSAANILNVDAKTRFWLKQKSKQVCGSKETCGAIDSLYR